MNNTLGKIASVFGLEIKNVKARDQNLEARIRKKFNVKTNFGLEILKRSEEFIDTIEKNGYSFSLLEELNEMLLVSIDDTKFYVESVEDIFIITEVFVDADYNFLPQSPHVLVDIGLNIGVTSIFLSQNEKISRVYGYEPVEYTFQLAKKNIEVNQIENIEIINKGVGDSNRKETFAFNKSFKGNTGKRGDLSYSINKLSEEEKTMVDVEIESVGDVFDRIKLEKDEKLMLKVDCEGGEYEIIESLEKNQLLSKVNMFVIEWHDKGAKPLEEILKRNGFQLISRRLEVNSGLIYAYQ